MNGRRGGSAPLPPPPDAALATEAAPIEAVAPLALRDAGADTEPAGGSPSPLLLFLPLRRPLRFPGGACVHTRTRLHIEHFALQVERPYPHRNSAHLVRGVYAVCIARPARGGAAFLGGSARLALGPLRQHERQHGGRLELPDVEEEAEAHVGARGKDHILLQRLLELVLQPRRQLNRL